MAGGEGIEIPWCLAEAGLGAGSGAAGKLENREARKVGTGLVETLLGAVSERPTARSNTWLDPRGRHHSCRSAGRR
jgi:hypothetical protein